MYINIDIMIIFVIWRLVICTLWLCSVV